MVPARDSRNLADLFRPGDLRQKIKRVDDVGFDLYPLGRVQAAFGNGKKPDLLRLEEIALDAVGISKRLSRDFDELVELSAGEDGGLVGVENGLEVVVNLRQIVDILLFERADQGESLVARALEEVLHLPL